MKPNVHQFPEQADPAALLQYKIAVMQAYADGAQLELRSRYDSAAPWGPAMTPPAFDWLNYLYRIQPPPAKPTTVLGWLCTLPEGYKQRAVENLHPRVADEEAGSLALALFWAFDWSDTPEGDRFWADMHNWSYGRGKLPELPTKKPTDTDVFEKWWSEADACCGYDSHRAAFDAGVAHGRANP